MEEGKKNSTESPPPLLKGGLNAKKPIVDRATSSCSNELIQKRIIANLLRKFHLPWHYRPLMFGFKFKRNSILRICN